METHDCGESAKKDDGREKWFIDRFHLSTVTKIRSLENKEWCLGVLDFPEFD
jgi:hypothetical protein